MNHFTKWRLLWSDKPRELLYLAACEIRWISNIYIIIYDIQLYITGGDTSKDDGIYSTYVTNFTDNGRYHVKVKVNDSPVSVVMKDKIVGAGGSGAAGRNRQRRNTGSRQQTENFQRVTSAGSFRLENFTAGNFHLISCSDYRDYI